ncbi:MAG: YceI family protein [Pseudomonadota bacterium]|nr:YceI family protein [Pseudomonadota bacterium]
MTPRLRWSLTGLLWATLLAGWTSPAAAQEVLGTFDPEHTRFGFELRTRWGQRVQGTFPQYAGEVLVLPDGKHQVRIRLATGAVEVAGSERYTQMARGEGFFDAERHPLIEFVSDPHHPELAHDGGKLRGKLSMHGATRVETFALAPSECSRPGLGCDVRAQGSVRRDAYGLDGWKLVLGDRVRFDMQVRLDEPRR